MMTKSKRLSGSNYGNAVETGDDITVLENSNVMPSRECVGSNTNKCDNLDVFMEDIVERSDISSVEKEDLIVISLKSEPEKIHVRQKKVGFQKTNGVTLDDDNVCSDILRCSNGHNKLQSKKSRKPLGSNSVLRKKSKPTSHRKPRRGFSRKFKPVPQTKTYSPMAANTLLMKRCDDLLKRLMKHHYSLDFRTPVDANAWNIPDYFTIIKNPMDLGTVTTKLASGAYSNPLEFYEDVKLTFSNAMTYNPPANNIHIMASALDKLFEARWKTTAKKISKTNDLPVPTKPYTDENVEASKKYRKVSTVLRYDKVKPPAKHDVRPQNMMMAKSNRLSGGYYGNAVETAGESEGSGSSGPVDTEITVSENSSAPSRRCVGLNTNQCDNFDVPYEVFRPADMTPVERKDLAVRLRSELEQVQLLKKKLGLQRTNGFTLSSSNDVVRCDNGHNRLQLDKSRKPLVPSSVSRTKSKPTSQKPRQGISGKFGLAPQTKTCSPIAANTLLMKQCDDLLKRLMKHQHAWVFNKPVDADELNIPDYFTIIKNPMDLGTVKRKLASGAYSSPLEFCDDVKLTFSNAMTYNPPSNNVHVMAATLNKFFEVRWKTIAKKISKINDLPVPTKPYTHENVEATKSMPPSKKRKISTIPHYAEVIPPAKQVMTAEEKSKLGKELESLLGELPLHIVNFLREHSLNGGECVEDEFEIDIDALSNDTLSTLRKLLDEYLQAKQKRNEKAGPCEIELLNDSGPSNLSLQPLKGDDDLGDEDVDIGGNEPPVTSYPPVEIEKDLNKRFSPESSSDSDSSTSTDSESESAKASPVASKVAESLGHGAHSDEKNQPVVGGSGQEPNCTDSDQCLDGDSAPTPVSPNKLYRAALLKNRFADTILKAREKTLPQGRKVSPEELHKEREKLEMERRKEKARLQAEAKAAEDARQRAKEEAKAELQRQIQREREAARQALIEVEKSVHVEESSRVLEDLEKLRTAPVEPQPSTMVEAMSPDDYSPDGLGSFKFGSNPLEQLGLYMKKDDEEEFGEPPPSSPHPVNDVEEGEID